MSAVDVLATGWRVERIWNRNSLVEHWKVHNSNGDAILNQRGRVKRFRSEKAATDALAALARCKGGGQ